MTLVEYLTSQRLSAIEQAAFDAEYGITHRVPFPTLTGTELYEAHTHHEESHYGSSH